MKILVVNAGSSSLKYQLIDMENEAVLAKGNCEQIGTESTLTHKVPSDESKNIKSQSMEMPDHATALSIVLDTLVSKENGVIDSVKEIDAVGHRVLHGAEKFSGSVLVTDEVEEAIKECFDLGPLHNPANLTGIKACQKIMPDVPQVAVFDTGFHQTMPDYAYMYALPYEYYEKYGIRRYGFHGTSHRFVSKALADAMGKDIKDLKIVSCHLGNGSSITAVDGGKSVDTSMGFTPLDGVLMGTRTGSVDPSAVTYIQEKHGFSAAEMSEYMNKKSGFLGVSGISSDNRDITAAAQKGDKRAILASEMLQYQIKKYIGSYAAVMNGLDAVLFTGGIGENAWEVREGVCKDMEFFGIKIDTEKNKSTRGELIKISTPDSKVEVWIVPTNEELLIARDTLAMIK